MKEKTLDDYIYISLMIACVLFASLFLVYHYFFSNIPISSCFIYENFGIYCPGCGCTRAFEALLHLDILTSVYYNPAVLYFAFIIFIYIVSQTLDRLLKHKNFFMSFSNVYLYIGIGILIINCIVRNFLLYFYHIRL